VVNTEWIKLLPLPYGKNIKFQVFYHRNQIWNCWRETQLSPICLLLIICLGLLCCPTSRLVFFNSRQLENRLTPERRKPSSKKQFSRRSFNHQNFRWLELLLHRQQVSVFVSVSATLSSALVSRNGASGLKWWSTICYY